MLTTTTTTLLALLSSGYRFVHESGKIIALNDDQIELFADANRPEEVAESTKVLSLEEFLGSASFSVRGGSFKGRQAQLIGLTPEFVKVVLPDSGKSTRIKKRFVGLQKKGVRRSPRLAAMLFSSSTDLPDLSLMEMVESLPIALIDPSETGPTEDVGSSADFQVDEPVEPIEPVEPRRSARLVAMSSSANVQVNEPVLPPPSLRSSSRFFARSLGNNRVRWTPSTRFVDLTIEHFRKKIADGLYA